MQILNKAIIKNIINSFKFNKSFNKLEILNKMYEKLNYQYLKAYIIIRIIRFTQICMQLYKLIRKLFTVLKLKCEAEF